MPYKIVGLSGSPVKKGNVDAFLSSIMDVASLNGLETETIHLSSIGTMPNGTIFLNS
jgi:multimeric flavodoxin WrbA